MIDELKDQQGIPEALADEPTREMLAKARKQTRAYLAKKLKVTKGTVRRIEKRTDLYLSTLRSYVEAVGGKLSLIVEFPDRTAVTLAGFGDATAAKKKENRPKAKAKTAAKPKPGTRRAA